MNSTSTYDRLYSNLKNHYIVQNNNSEYTLGEYMLMKANGIDEKSSLPVTVHEGTSIRTLQSIVSYVNDKLTIKNPPAKDKTMKAFPFRTSLASLLSALLVCTVVVTYGLVGSSRLSSDAASASAEYPVSESFEEYNGDTEISSVEMY